MIRPAGGICKTCGAMRPVEPHKNTVLAPTHGEVEWYGVKTITIPKVKNDN